MNDKEEVVPDVMVIVLVQHEPVLYFTVEELSFLVANEAEVLLIVLTVLRDLSKLGESIDNNTEDNVE